MIKENTIGQNIRKYRELRKYTQKELADILKLNSTRVSNWEQGQNNPPADMLSKICIALNISASELLGMKLDTDELSYEERKVIKCYRGKPEMQYPVKVLLGIESSK